MFLSRTIFCFSLFATIVLSSYAQEENASQPTGRILGRVFDSDSLEALKGVTVVIEKSKIETTTDLEGRYRLINVKPGNYSLLFFKENYQRTRVSVEGVEADRTKIVDLPINPDYSNLETLDAFEITAEELAGSDIQLLSLRQESMVVMDAMGSFDMSRLGAGNVADALTKMVGTSVQDGKYVVVRGLADRYSNATFNGVPIPSSDVYRNTPQLDLFPSIAVDSISIKKTMSPELGAAFSGGSVDVVTKAYPDELTVKLSIGTKYDSLLFEKGSYLTYEDGSSDKWGFGLDARKLPDGYQDTAFWSPTKLNPSTVQISEFMSGMDPIFVPHYEDAEVGRSIGIEFGNLIDKKDYSLGVIFSLDFENSFSTQKTYQQRHNYLLNANDWNINPESSFEIQEGTRSAEIGSYFQTSLIPNENHEIGLILLWSHTGDKIAKYNQNLWKEGISGETAPWGENTEDVFVEGFELAWEERDMLLPQLYGKHALNLIPDWQIDWRISQTTVSLDEPERRSIQRAWEINKTPSQQYRGPSRARSGTQFFDRIPPKHVWRSMEDKSLFHRIDLKSPRWEIENGFLTLEFGISGDEMDREFDQTELVLQPQLSNVNAWSSSVDKSFYAASQAYPEDFTSPGPETFPSSGLDVNNYLIHPTYQNVLTYDAKPNSGDYDGNSKLSSFYWGSLVELPNDIRIRAGARLEDYHAKVSPKPDVERVTVGPYVESWLVDAILSNSESQAVELKDKSIFPTLTLTKDWESGIKASVSYGETTARPNFRELAYVETYDPISDSIFKGNPALKPSSIQNYDIRIDWNLSETDLISCSAFLKKIKRPIQATTGNPGLQLSYNNTFLNWAFGTDTFINSDSAEVYGFEIEWKKGLEQYSSILRGFRIGGNLTWSDSNVQLSQMEMNLFPKPNILPDYERLNVANRSARALEGQSDLIYTVDLSYNNEDLGILSTLVYSFYDARLYAAAYQYPDDFWEDSFSNLDFINSFGFGKDDDWKLKIAAKNLTADERVIRIRGTSAIRKKFETSRIFSLSLEKEF